MNPEELSALVREAVRDAFVEQRERITPAYLTRRQACAYLNVSMATLERAAFHGGGPAFVRIGKAVRYSREALDTWAKAREQTRISVDESGL